VASSQSTYTLQNIYDDLVARGDLDAGWDVAGYSVRPILNVANKAFKNIVGGEGMFPWKWNQFNLPQFYWNSWQQDYAIPGLTNLAWLQEGMAIDINNPQMPKPWATVKIIRNQPRASGAYLSNSAYVQPLCSASFLPNSSLYYGTWGGAAFGNSTWGNNPQSGQVIANPLGNGSSMPQNPVLQIKDANGNLLVLTGYGTLGTTAPVAAVAATPGTAATPGSGDTTTWTVVDPYGQGIRISPVPSATGTVWQMNLVGQYQPTKFSSSSSLTAQTLFPLTDEFYQYFLDGCAVECLLYQANPKKRAQYDDTYKVWFRSITDMRKENDRELEGNTIKPSRSIIGAGGATRTGNLGPFWPFGGPVS
jgi:hypothetical protein